MAVVRAKSRFARIHILEIALLVRHEIVFSDTCTQHVMCANRCAVLIDVRTTTFRSRACSTGASPAPDGPLAFR